MRSRPELRVSPATPDDVPFIMRTERLPGYGKLVGRWDESRHLEALADENYACFIGTDTQAVGFCIVKGWLASDGAALIQRLAIAVPNRGYGHALLRTIVGIVFDRADIHRLVIGCFPDNERARRVYENVGFRAEGVARGSVVFHGERRDELILAMVRPDWEALNHNGGRQR